MVISHNIQALNTNRITNENINLNAKSTEKISSGYKINHVGDNPVGLAMSETMRRQIRGLNQGIENTKAAINFCQTADGALNEVTEMLQRINELAVKAENGTNLNLDRQYLQAEVKQLLTEIDRVADVTTFNEIPIFKGIEKEVIPVPDDSSVIEGDIPFTDFTIADVSLGTAAPFGPSSNADILKLQAIVKNNTIVNDRAYDLIFGSGSLSYSSFRLTYQKDGVDVTEKVAFSALKNLGEYEAGTDQDGNPRWKRSFLYEDKDNDVNIKITQEITAHNPQDQTQEKYYNISYSFANNGDKDITLDFMFNAETGYAGRDYGESYFINDGSGKRLDESCIFIDGGSWVGSAPIVPDGTMDNNIQQNMPGSFSIIDVKNTLAFSEKISFVSGSEPNALMIGNYGYVNDWGKYGDNILGSNLLGNTIANKEGAGTADVAVSLFWNKKINKDATSEVSFNFGIVDYKKDSNLSGIMTPDTSVIEPQRQHYYTKSLWIQTGNEKGSGLWLKIDEMNTEVLGIDKIDLTTIEGATDANTRVKEALHKLAVGRSKIGAQQNRLEHTVVNEENIVEKVTASESLIRDTDLSSEMVRYSNLSVLLQMGQNMIAQADQRVEKILTFLQ